jgi:hypothetical protein
MKKMLFMPLLALVVSQSGLAQNASLEEVIVAAQWPFKAVTIFRGTDHA